MRIRIEDVAAAAGVSMKTVSRVLNREPNVREETRQQVLKTVERLQYKPNPSARSLAGQRSYALALAFNNPSRNYLMEIQIGVLDACREQHYNLVLAPIGSGRVRSGIDMKALFEHFGPDGVVLIPPLTDDKTVLAYLEENEVPFCCISPRHPQQRIGTRMDEPAAAAELVAHLVALGHRRIGHISGARGHGAREWRVDGYRRALAEAGIGYDPALVVEGEFVFESGVRGANQLLDLDDPPTAIFAANDDMAAGVIRAAAERGLMVPKHLSVCGFDDTPISRHIHPALTTVHQPTSDMGRLATLELLSRLRDPEAGRMVLQPHTLLPRESTGPAPRR